MRSAAKDLGFVSRREYEELVERLEALETQLGIEPCIEIKEEPKKSSKKSSSKKAAKEESAEVEAETESK